MHRLGFGTMQLTGPGVWGPPADRGAAVAVLRRAAELGVDLFDTADSYGPEVAEDLLREALHPYDGLTVATKAGFLRTGPGASGARADARSTCASSARDACAGSAWSGSTCSSCTGSIPPCPPTSSSACSAALRAEGKVGAVGLSEVGSSDIERARAVVDVATVQNRYNLVGPRLSDDVLRYCTEQGIGFLPWFPIAAGGLADPGGPVAEAAERLGASAPQVALAWLLQRSSVMLPIPGTSSIGHLEDNCAAAALELDLETVEKLDAAA